MMFTLGNKSARGCGSSWRSAVCFREPGNGGQISAFGIVNIETVVQAFYKTSEFADWTGLVKRGLVKRGLVKRGLVKPPKNVGFINTIIYYSKNV